MIGREGSDVVVVLTEGVRLAVDDAEGGGGAQGCWIGVRVSLHTTAAWGETGLMMGCAMMDQGVGRRGADERVLAEPAEPGVACEAVRRVRAREGSAARS